MTNKEKKELVDQAISNIRQGKTKHFIHQYLMKSLKLSKKTATGIYDTAVGVIREYYSQDKERQRDLITFRFEDLYEKAYDGAKYGICAGILKELSELQGLKTTNINLEANITDESVGQLTQVLQLIQITATEGIDSVIQQGLKQFTSDPEPDTPSDT